MLWIILIIAEVASDPGNTTSSVSMLSNVMR